MALHTNHIAQVFTIDPVLYPTGICLASLTLCFAAIDDTDDVNVGIYPVINGIPDNTTKLHNADITMSPVYINYSATAPNIDDPSVSTDFVFPTPIFLTPGDYAIIIKTKSPNYQLHVADKTLPLYNSYRQVSYPPYIGGFFRTQNADKWTADPNVILMFKFKQAIFTTSASKSVQMTIAPTLGDDHAQMIFLSTNNLHLKDTQISYEYQAHYDDGSKDAAPVTFSPETNVQTPKTLLLSANTDTPINVFVSLISNNQNVSPVIDLTRMSLTTISWAINNGELSNDLIYLANTGLYPNAYNGFANSIPSVSIDAPLSNVGVQATAICNFNSDNTVANIVLTNVGSGYYTTPNITVNVPSVIQSGQINASAIIAGETSKTGGNALARYITRYVTLPSGFEASGLNVWLTANKPQGTNIEVYYKILSTKDKEQNLDKRPWVLMYATENQNSLSLNDYDMISYKYSTTTGIATSGKTPFVTNDTSYATQTAILKTFTVFAIKICLFTNDKTNIPFVKNLRAIALA
jgi:hypothetical protein